MILRAGRDADAAGFIDLIAACWAEYPGAGLDVDGENPELRALATYFAAAGGALWVHEADGVIAGMIGTKPLGDDVWELCKVYVAPALRGAGLAAHLVDTAERFAAAAGGREMILWTDTKFDRAHRFYEKCGYIRHGGIRALDDRSRTLEFGYLKPLADLRVMALDAAAAPSAVPGLAEILRACVAGGAAVSYLPPLDRPTAQAHFRQAARDVALGKRVLFAAWRDGALVGTVQLVLDMPPNQPHRAEIAKLLVHPDARRRGVARLLLARAEAAAVAAGRRLLVLDTKADDAAEPLYRRQGWIEAGRIPDFALNPDGTSHTAVIFYKHLV